MENVRTRLDMTPTEVLTGKVMHALRDSSQRASDPVSLINHYRSDIPDPFLLYTVRGFLRPRHLSRCWRPPVQTLTKMLIINKVARYDTNRKLVNSRYCTVAS